MKESNKYPCNHKATTKQNIALQQRVLHKGIKYPHRNYDYWFGHPQIKESKTHVDNVDIHILIREVFYLY